jgi:hypothetical protein
VSDPGKLDAEAALLLDAPQPLSERAAGYVVGFLIGLAAIGLVGALIAWLGAPLRSAAGYTAIAVGAFLVLAGGSSGAGLTSLGIGEGIGRVVAHSNPTFLLDDDGAGPPHQRGSRKYGVVLEPTDREDLIGRLRKGLRPEPNPPAFWAVIAGLLYAGIGVALVMI